LQPGEFNRDFEAAPELEQPEVVNVDDVQLRVNVDVAPRDSSNKK
jgi:hypothetical protein